MHIISEITNNRKTYSPLPLFIDPVSMSKNKKNKIENNLQLKKEIGQRFRQFRQAIGKSQGQLAQILSHHKNTIYKIESGELFPTLRTLECLLRGSKIDLNWLITGKGSFFPTKGKSREEKPQAPDNSLRISIRKDHPYYEQYAEMVDLMQIPVIEQNILAELEKLKAVAEEEIEEWKKKKKKR